MTAARAVLVMRPHIIPALAIAAEMLICPTASAAQPPICLEHDDATIILDRHYQEQQIGIGLANMGSSVVELYVSESGSWTILVTRADGLSCVMAAGEDWSISAPDSRPEKSL